MSNKEWAIKAAIFLLLLVFSGCAFHVEDPHALCGYDETPYYAAPSSCQPNPWAVHGGGCCTWIVEEYYSECIETWCYNEHICAWQLYHYSCHPI
jgi:hypothetical protein